MTCAWIVSAQLTWVEHDTDGEIMSEVVALPAENAILGSPKDKSRLLRVMDHYLRICQVDRSQPVLVVGGGREDQEILGACGFEKIVLSNLDGTGQTLDAEAITLPDNSYSIVFAHAILHHCRCPHKALGEMVRVAQKHVLFLEPNDSRALRFLIRLGYSFPYELAAVATQNCLHGGLRNGPIPNYIYRWTRRAVIQCVAAYHPERQFDIHTHPFWDFYVNEFELLNRKESRVASLAQMMGPKHLIRVLHAGQSVLNLLPALRKQGNKFFCAISKRELQPWIEMRDGHYALRK
jgi:SAM-dependent methyltransferase